MKRFFRQRLNLGNRAGPNHGEQGLKRLLIASTYLPPTPGGAEQVAWETAKRLVENYDVHILTAGNDSTCERDQITIHYIPPKRPYNLTYSTFYRNRVRTAYKSAAPDILHSHMALPWGFIFAKASCAKVVTCHGGDVYPKPKSPIRLLVNRALENADIVTAPSRWIANYVREEYDISCRHLPNGVDTTIFKPHEGQVPNTNVVLYLGRGIERKGIFEFFEAARALPNYEFWFVGLKHPSIRVPALPNLKVLGRVKDNVACYNQASICVFPSHWENFPIVGLEAMACGKPIVATKLGFSEYVENGRDGLIVEPARPSELIDSIRYLMENSDERTRIGQNAREKAMQYDWNIIMQQYEALYDGLPRAS